MRDEAHLDQLCINTIRTLSIDAVRKAQSGHPGNPMDAAPTVYCLWQRFLRCDPDDADWPNRDRFVFSPGHASMLLYSLPYLCGVKTTAPTDEGPGGQAVTLDDIKRFRQAGSRCKVVAQHFGFEPAHVVAAAREQPSRHAATS